MAMMDSAGFIVCALAKDPRSPFRCKGCGKPVDVSPTGQVRIDTFKDEGQTLLTLCNRCGGEIVDRLNAAGDSGPKVEMEVLPRAMDYIERHDPKLAADLLTTAARSCPFCSFQASTDAAVIEHVRSAHGREPRP